MLALPSNDRSAERLVLNTKAPSQPSYVPVGTTTSVPVTSNGS